MKTLDVPEPLWAKYLDDFSRVHLGQRVRLWASGPDSGLMREAVNLPLIGIDLDIPAGRGIRRGRVDVIVGDTPDVHTRHRVRGPTAIRAATAEDGEVVSLEIEAEDGSTTFLNLCLPASKTTPAAFA